MTPDQAEAIIQVLGKIDKSLLYIAISMVLVTMCIWMRR